MRIVTIVTVTPNKRITMNAMMIRTISKIHELTTAGWGYDDAESRVVQELGCRRATARIRAAYKRFYTVFDATDCDDCDCDPEW